MNIRTVLIGAALLALPGCGVVYTAPSVSGDLSGTWSHKDTKFDVNVVDLTYETALQANADAPPPRALPAAFRPVERSARAAQQIPVGVSMGGYAGADLPPLPPAPTGAVTRPGGSDVRLPPPTAQQSYTIGVSDVLVISANTQSADPTRLADLLSASTSRNEYVVQDDGSVTVPAIGTILVAGRTVDEARMRIFDALVEKRLDPGFTLEIAAFNSKRVSIGGAIRDPKLLPITLSPLRLYEAVDIAGGLGNVDPDYGTVRLFRDGNIYNIPTRLMATSPDARNVVLQDGDSIFIDPSYDLDRARAFFGEQLTLRQARMTDIQFRQAQLQFRQQMEDLTFRRQQFNAEQLLVAEESRRAIEAEQRDMFKERLSLGAEKRDYAFIAGEVASQKRVPLPYETAFTLADMMGEAGGVRPETGDLADVYLIRRPAPGRVPSVISIYHLDASNAANLALATLLEVRANDVVFVEAHPITSWNRVLSQILPSTSLLTSVPGALGN